MAETVERERDLETRAIVSHPPATTAVAHNVAATKPIRSARAMTTAMDGGGTSPNSDSARSWRYSRAPRDTYRSKMPFQSAMPTTSQRTAIVRLVTSGAGTEVANHHHGDVVALRRAFGEHADGRDDLLDQRLR